MQRPHVKVLAVGGVALALTILVAGFARFGGFQAQAGPGFCCEVRGNPCTVKTLQECINVSGAYTPVSQNVCNVVICNVVGGGANNSSSSAGPFCGNGIVEGLEQCDGASLPPKPANFSCPADVNVFKTLIDTGAYADVGSCCTTSTYCNYNNVITAGGTGSFSGAAWCLTMYSLNGRSLNGQNICAGKGNTCGAGNTCGTNCKCQGSSSSTSSVCGYLYTYSEPPGSTTVMNQVGGGGNGTIAGNMHVGSCSPPPYPSAGGCLTNSASPNAGTFNGPSVVSPPNAPYSFGGQFMVGSQQGTPLNGVSYAGCTDRYVALSATPNASVMLDSGNHVQVMGTGIVSAPLSTGAWHQITYTWDGTVGTLYIDGAVAATSSTQPGQSSAQIAAAWNCLESKDVKIDDYFAYPGALTAAQVAGLKNGQMPPFATGSYCPFCGNGTKDGSEQCDDGNNKNGDGCGAGCVIEPNFQCSVPGGGSSSAAPGSCANPGNVCRLNLDPEPCNAVFQAGTCFAGGQQGKCYACPTGATASSAASGCMVTGCNKEICQNAGLPPVMNSCTWRRQYRCYLNATCAKQLNGQCGWTQDAQLTDCLKCGDGVCDASETFMTDVIAPGVCAEDCGFAPFTIPPPDCVKCGDGKCNNNENVQNCAKDCTNTPNVSHQNPPGCPPLVCGDGFCDALNNERFTCPQDCN